MADRVEDGTAGFEVIVHDGELDELAVLFDLERDTDEATALTATYFEAWKAKDFATLRAVLADDVTFQGPLASLDTAD